MSLFCRHEWELIDKEVIPPALVSLRGLETKSSVDTRIAFDAMREKVVHVFQCKKCTKLKRLVSP